MTTVKTDKSFSWTGGPSASDGDGCFKILGPPTRPTKMATPALQKRLARALPGQPYPNQKGNHGLKKGRLVRGIREDRRVCWWGSWWLSWWLVSFTMIIMMMTQVANKKPHLNQVWVSASVPPESSDNIFCGRTWWERGNPQIFRINSAKPWLQSGDNKHPNVWQLVPTNEILTRSHVKSSLILFFTW